MKQKVMLSFVVFVAVSVTISLLNKGAILGISNHLIKSKQGISLSQNSSGLEEAASLPPAEKPGTHLNSSITSNPGCEGRSLLQYKAIDTGRRYHHPPLVHYVKLSVTALELNFREYTSVMSVYKFLKPEKIMFHTYTELYGKYWDKIMKFKNVKIETHKIPLLHTIGGGKRVYWIQHVADYLKLSKVLEHGGVALDFDVIIINGTRLKLEQSLSECVLAAEPKYINGGFYSCIKNSAFMSAWVESYHKDHKPLKWIYNISLYPLKLLTKKKVCYNVHVDDTICISPGWDTRFNWLKRNEVWRNKTAAHYFVKNDIPQDGEGLLKENFILAQMIQYVHNA